MKQFLRLSDGQWPFTEMDLDHAISTPNPKFKPNETEYVEPRQWAKPALNEVLEEAVEVKPVLIDGVWTQQWSVVALYSTQAEIDAAEAAHIADLAAKAKQAAIDAIEATFSESVKAITAGYSEDEIKTWDKQLSEATAFTANSTASTPFLDSLRGVTGDVKADLVGKVLANANSYSAALGTALGNKQKAIKDLGVAK